MVIQCSSMFINPFSWDSYDSHDVWIPLRGWQRWPWSIHPMELAAGGGQWQNTAETGNHVNQVSLLSGGGQAAAGRFKNSFLISTMEFWKCFQLVWLCPADVAHKLDQGQHILLLGAKSSTNRWRGSPQWFRDLMRSSHTGPFQEYTPVSPLVSNYTKWQE